MSGYESGTVATATVEGQTWRLMRGTEYWWGYPLSKSRGGGVLRTGEVADLRPLVVIDPEDREQVERLVDLYVDFSLGHYVNDMQAALREFANPKPPKPEEPTGLGAVVEDAEGHVWVRIHESYGDLLWRMEIPNTCAAKYADIDAVTVLSEGVKP